MPFFRIRLIVALIVGVTLVSVASTYFDVLAHKLALRRELVHRSQALGAVIQPQLEPVVGTGSQIDVQNSVNRLKDASQVLGLAVFHPNGQLMASSGAPDVFRVLKPGVLDKTIKRGAEVSAFGHDGDWQWLEDAYPLHTGGQIDGVLVVLEDARYIREEGNAVWGRSFLRIAAFVVLIVAVTLLMVRWFLMKPMMRVAERMRLVRMGHAKEEEVEEPLAEIGMFTPLVTEVERMAGNLVKAREAAQTEARLRDQGEHVWTAERLAVNIGERFGSSKIFAVSNREPYMHVKQGWETKCIVPPSGLVTAIEPVLRACDGVWVAHGSGSEDASMVDEFDHLRVPPEDPRYTLRRVWLTEEEEKGYYDGFANEGLWPLCHIAHTRPLFRTSDWEAYQHVNEKFAKALLEEMEDSPNPVVFVQDYHFALLPRLIKQARPDARVAIFWHIPWPNPEAFGICPWQAELLDGLLGADIVGFHTQLHCNNFLGSVDRVLEARTDREHMTALRMGHVSSIRPYPISVSIEGFETTSRRDLNRARPFKRHLLLDEFHVRCETLAVGVDRLDYTKGIVERFLAIEQLLIDHPYHIDRTTLVQIAAPSRTRIPSYADLKRQVEETAERINKRFQTATWKPIVLIEKQCSHEEVTRWYRAADICLVTSLHDGMNLVAKEFLMARNDEDGVLVLSIFTGAASELRDALQVNPYDLSSVAETIHQGLELNRAERRVRMQRMRRYVFEHNIYRWAADILADLHEVRIDGHAPAEVGRPGPVPVPAAGAPRAKLAEKARIG